MVALLSAAGDPHNRPADYFHLRRDFNLWKHLEKYFCQYHCNPLDYILTGTEQKPYLGVFHDGADGIVGDALVQALVCSRRLQDLHSLLDELRLGGL